MTNPETTVLYALSTLAQTCAALTAFVGAVGLYRLQSLRDRHRDLLHHILDSLGHRPAQEVDVLASARKQAPRFPFLVPLVQEIDAIPRGLERGRWSLMVFEAWNLAVIGASLVGFNHVPTLAASPWTL
jgi:hypothetical protein